YNLGLALRAKGDRDGAIAEYRETIRLDPQFTPAHYNLGGLLRIKGDADGAIAQFRDVLRIDPKYAWAHSGLAWILATGPDGLRDGRRAVEHATRACELTGWKDPSCLNNLGAACAEA